MIGWLGAVVFFEVLFVMGALGRAAVAALAGMRVEAIVFGFGPPLAGRGRVRLAAIPLGAFCRVAGLDPIEAPLPGDEPRAFHNRPLVLRLLVALGWPVGVQLFVATFIAGAALLVGVPRETGGAVVVSVAPGSPAETAGLRKDDEIVAIDGRAIEYADLAARIDTVGDREVPLEVRRDAAQKTLRVRLRREGGRYRLGVSVAPGRAVARPSVTDALFDGARFPFAQQQRILAGMVEVYSGRVVAEVVGPVGMTAMIRDQATPADAARELGLFAAYLVLVALLPLPPLPGARFWMILAGWRGPRRRSAVPARDAGTVDTTRPRFPAPLAAALAPIALVAAVAIHRAVIDEPAMAAIAILAVALGGGLALGRPRAWSVGVLAPVLFLHASPDPLGLAVGVALPLVVFATLHLPPVRRYFGLTCPACARVAARPVPASRRTCCMACGSTWVAAGRASARSR